MTQGHGPDMRASALAVYGEEWGAAISDAAALMATFKRLSEKLDDLDKHGMRITLTFPNRIAQEWWRVYRESRGDLIPAAPAESPPMMEKVDERPVETAS